MHKTPDTMPDRETWRRRQLIRHHPIQRPLISRHTIRRMILTILRIMIIFSLMCLCRIITTQKWTRKEVDKVKKTIVAIFAFVMGLMMWPAEEVKAYPGGLLNEKEITYQSGLNSYEQTMFVTDNDIETYVNIGSTNRVYYDFAEPVVLDGYYFYIVRAGGGATGATLRYYNEEGDQLFIDTVNKPPAQESGEETFRKHTPVNGVKREEVKRFKSTTLYLAEIDVFDYIDTELPVIH